jgi:hypothetical protein
MQALRLAQTPLAHLRHVDYDVRLRNNTLWRGPCELHFKQGKLHIESAGGLSQIKLDLAQPAQLALAHGAVKLTRTKIKPLQSLPAYTLLLPKYECCARAVSTLHPSLELSITIDGIALPPAYVTPCEHRGWFWYPDVWSNLCSPRSVYEKSYRTRLHLAQQRLVCIDVGVRPHFCRGDLERDAHSFVDPRLLRCVLDALCAADQHLPSAIRACRP